MKTFGVFGLGTFVIGVMWLLFRDHPIPSAKFICLPLLALWTFGSLGNFDKFRNFITLRWLRGEEIPLSFAVARLGVGFAFWSLSFAARPLGLPTAQEHFACFDPGQYDPVGPFCFLCPNSPSAELFDFCRWILPISSVFLMVGLFTRTSFLVSTFAFWVLASGCWLFGFLCHGHTPFLLAALPLLAGSSQAYSVDGLLRRLLGRAPAMPHATRPAVIGAQVMVGLVFLSAASHKIFLGNGQFMMWVFSDNLRNLVINQHLVLHQELGSFLGWTFAHQWAWKLLALSAVLCQLLPISGVFFLQRPWIRLACGLAMMMEVVSLKLVMGLFPQQFMVMAVLFVDWEYFEGLILRSRPTPAALLNQDRSVRFQHVAVGGLILLQAVVGLTCYKSIRWLYPFSAFPMFSQIYAPRPYASHQSWYFQQSVWNINSSPDITTEQMDRLWTMHHALPWDCYQTPEESTRGAVATIAGLVCKKNEVDPKRQPGIDVRELDIKAALFELPPYPAREMIVRAEANFSKWRHGKIQAIEWHWKVENGIWVLEYRSLGFAPKSLHLGLILSDTWSVRRLQGVFDLRCGAIEVWRGDGPAPHANSVRVPLKLANLVWLVFIITDDEGNDEIWSGSLLYPG